VRIPWVHRVMHFISLTSRSTRRAIVPDRSYPTYRILIVSERALSRVQLFNGLPMFNGSQYPEIFEMVLIVRRESDLALKEQPGDSILPWLNHVCMTHFLYLGRYLFFAVTLLPPCADRVIYMLKHYYYYYCCYYYYNYVITIIGALLIREVCDGARLP